MNSESTRLLLRDTGVFVLQLFNPAIFPDNYWEQFKYCIDLPYRTHSYSQKDLQIDLSLLFFLYSYNSLKSSSFKKRE